VWSVLEQLSRSSHPIGAIDHDWRSAHQREVYAT
jgi:hypothetical protein